MITLNQLDQNPPEIHHKEIPQSVFDSVLARVQKTSAGILLPSNLIESEEKLANRDILHQRAAERNTQKLFLYILKIK